MTKGPSKATPTPETVFRSVGAGIEGDIDIFLRRAPQFSALVEAADDEQSEVSDSQSKFLSEFAAELRKALGKDDTGM